LSDTFLDKFVSLADETEIPPEFVLWSGLMAVSCILGRNIYIDMGHFNIYPNVFCVLVAGSGKCRKSTAINLMEAIIRKVEPSPNIIGQKITPEALIKALKMMASNEDVILKGPKFEGCVIADELAVFLNKKVYDSGLGTLLIPLWDCRDIFEYRTIGRGAEVLEKIYFSLYAGTTISLLREAFPEKAIGDGLTSRILFVYSDIPGSPVPRPRITEKKKKSKEEIIRALMRIRILYGEMTFSKRAGEAYDEEYLNFYEKHPFYEDRYLSGYASRRMVHLLKLAMLFCISETEQLELRGEHIYSAIRLIEHLEESLPNVLKMVVASEKGDVLEIILLKIVKKGRITRSQLLQAMSHRVDAWELQQVIETLVQSDKIHIHAEGRVIMYIAGPG